MHSFKIYSFFLFAKEIFFRITRKSRLFSDEDDDDDLVAFLNESFRSCSSSAECAKKVENKRERLIPFGYIRKGLSLSHEEAARRREENTKKLLRNKKLVLVLDLDQTLIDSKYADKLTSEEYLKNEGAADDVSLFVYQYSRRLIKLRAFVRTFLEVSSDMFEMYMYTNAGGSHARLAARLLDPQGDYFGSRIISRSDRPDRKLKSLDLVLGQENVVLILDDTKEVWPDHKHNLITMESYDYFASNKSYKSLSEMKTDESETSGALASILKVLQEIHRLFFHPKLEVDVHHRDVRVILKTIRFKVLTGCVLFFGHGFWPDTVDGLRGTAEELGAVHCMELGSFVTHVVSLGTETMEALWAEENKKFLVHPRWVLAAYFSFQRQSEDKFSVHPNKI